VGKRPIGTIYLLKRAELAVRSCAEVALAEFDMTPAQLLMLFHLRDRHDLSAASLAREIGVRPQSIIGLIAEFERRGVLRREPSPEHRRVLRMRLTPAGRRLLADALRVAARIESELLARLDDAQLSALHEALTVIRERAEGHELHPGSIRAKAEEIMRSHLAARRRPGKFGARRSVSSGPGKARRLGQ
jgi:DNA-binding MarR family transcriptional regulator